MQTSGNIDDLVLRIREKARAEADAIIERAEKIAVRDISRAREETKQKLAAAEEEFNQQISAGRKALQAEISIQERRIIMTRREKAIDDVFNKALEKLAAENDVEQLTEILRKLILSAIDVLKLDRVKLTLNERDSKLLQESNILSGISGVKISIDEKNINCAGGVIVSDETERIFYDNTYEACLNRQREQLRTKLAEILGF